MGHRLRWQNGMDKPRLLLLDEPSLGLAPKLVDEVFDTVTALREAGVSRIVTHSTPASGLAPGAGGGSSIRRHMALAGPPATPVAAAAATMANMTRSLDFGIGSLSRGARRTGHRPPW